MRATSDSDLPSVATTTAVPKLPVTLDTKGGCGRRRNSAVSSSPILNKVAYPPPSFPASRADVFHLAGWGSAAVVAPKSRSSALPVLWQEVRDWRFARRAEFQWQRL